MTRNVISMIFDSMGVNAFGPLERNSSRRADADCLSSLKADLDSRFVVIHEDRFLANADGDTLRPLFLDGKTLRDKLKGALDLEGSIYLGDRGDLSFFALDVNDEGAGNLKGESGCGREFVDLRSNLSLLNEADANVIALARFLLNWNRRTQFCGVCGSRTNKLQDGHARKCAGESCGEEFYASMDPAIIVLVIRGNKALLGRARNWRSGLYSTLAGFVEPGETLEEAVRREVFEESGIRVGEVSYEASQSWLFPASLMLGFTAKALNEEIVMDVEEMDDVKWFTREQLLASPELFPSKTSIAFRLIRSWLDA